MAIIEKKIKLEGSRASEEIIAFFDSGFTYSCIQPTLAEKIEIILPLPKPMEFGTVKEGKRLEAKEVVRLNFYLDGYQFSDEFMLIPGLSEKALIGAATVQKWRMKLDFEHDEVIIDPRVTKLRLM